MQVQAETKRLLMELGVHARRVADADIAHEGAIMDERKARAELVDAIVATVRPALRAITSRVVVARAGDGTMAVAPWRGVFLSDLQPDGPRHGGPSIVKLENDRMRGRYTGRDLYLRADGAFIELRYDGPWSAVEGEVSSWRAQEVPFTSLDVVEVYWEGEILDALGVALIGQTTGKKGDATRIAIERAERVRAVALLLRAAL